MAQNLVVNGVTYNGVESLEMINENGEKVLYTEGGTGGGSGGGSGVISGEFTFDENTITTTIDIGNTYTNFIILAYNKVNISAGKGTFFCAVDKPRTRLYCVATNNSGSAIQTALYSESPTVTEESLTWTSTTLKVVTYEKSIEIKGGTSGTALGYFIGGVTYRWYAWTEGE